MLCARQRKEHANIILELIESGIDLAHVTTSAELALFFKQHRRNNKHRNKKKDLSNDSEIVVAESLISDHNLPFPDEDFHTTVPEEDFHLPQQLFLDESNASDGSSSKELSSVDDSSSDSELSNGPEFPLRYREPEDESEVEDESTQSEDGLKEWFQHFAGEDWQDHLRNFVTPQLTEEDLDNIHAFSLKVEGNMSRDLYQRMARVFADKMELDSEFLLYRRMDWLSGLLPKLFDCCVNSCCAYTTPEFQNLANCPFCEQPRRDSRNRPRKQFWYIPLIPRLQVLYKNPIMIEQIRYRSEYVIDPTTVKDVFDSEHYNNLLKKSVTVGNERLSHKYFEQWTDLALGHSLDGVTLFNRRKNQSSVTPIITVNYNLPPDTRNLSKNVITNAVIPGPYSPKDLKSFMHPLVEESHLLARGVETSMGNGQRFSMHAYYIRAFGDMVAMQKVMEMKGHNGKSHCRKCKIIGCPHTKGRVIKYYSPLMQPNREFWVLSEIPRRMHIDFILIPRKLDEMDTKAARNKFATLKGINGRSYLLDFPGICMVDSTPYDFMHLMFSNNAKNLTYIWKGRFKNLDQGSGNYEISAELWTEIGCEMTTANKTIPSAFSRLMPDISTNQHDFTAESYSFWICYLAPILLKGRLPPPYYKNFLKFKEIILMCLQYEITYIEIDALHILCEEWVQEYEKLYYQYNEKRLPFCTSTVHAVLHIAESILRSGPVWTSWAFVMERICGLIAKGVTSRLHPYGTINNRVKRDAQLTLIKLRYGLVEPEDLIPDAHSSKLRRGEQIYPNHPASVMCSPRKTHSIDGPSRTAIAKALIHEYGSQHFRHLKTRIPSSVELWGKVRILGRGDKIRSVAGMTMNGQERDSSFVRYEMIAELDNGEADRSDMDVEMDDNGDRSRWARRVFYGRVEYFLAVTLKPIEDDPLSLETDTTHLLAYITPCRTDGVDGAETLASYSTRTRGMGTKGFVNINVIQCSVGRVERKDEKLWYIVDRSRDAIKTRFIAGGIDED